MRSAVDTGRINVSVNNEPLTNEAVIGQFEDWRSIDLGKVNLLQGTNKIRVYSKVGGYELLSLQLKNQ